MREQWIHKEGKALPEAAIREHRVGSTPTNDR